jgi:heme exporter protein A
MALQLTTRALQKSFSRRMIFQNIDLTVQEGETLLIAGRNGSGKSTLVKILCGVLSPSKGSVDITGAGDLGQFSRMSLFGLVAPYLQVYDEFSAMENLELSASLRGVRSDAQAHASLLLRVALDPKRQDAVRGFSSGMKQRLKYALALAHGPRILILDEPMSNLDSDGMAIVREIMREQRERGMLIVATNDASDIDAHERKVDLNVGA